MEKPIMTFFKKADKEKNRIIIPKGFINQWGRTMKMDIYGDRIVLTPINKKGE